jgi:hypothetical protein
MKRPADLKQNEYKTHPRSCAMCDTIEHAMEINLRKRELRTDNGFIEDDDGTWKYDKTTPLWEFCRYLRTYDPLSKCNTADSLRKVQACMLAVGLAWDDVASFTEDDLPPVEEFCRVWDELKLPAGMTPPDLAAKQARQSPLILADGFRGPGQTEFLSFAYHLQMFMGDRDIYLPCRLVGRFLRVSHQTAWARIRAGERDGYLIVKRRGKPQILKQDTPATASEFRFLVHKFDPEKLVELTAKPEHAGHNSVSSLGTKRI